MKDIYILIIIVIILAAYFFYKNSTASQSYSVPTQYKGSEGLDYIRKNYASELSQAKSLCAGQFKGEWIDSSSEIGCQNMQGFSTSYCGMDIINNLVNMCNSIGGNPVCSSTQAICSV
jgi:hypothetical protein